MHPDSAEFQAAAARKFAEIRSRDTLPEELVRLIEGVLPLQARARAEAALVLPAPEDCADAAALFAGSPLLLRHSFPCDLERAKALAPALLDLLAQAGGEAQAAAKALRQALESGELDLEAALRALAAGDDTPFAQWRKRLPGSPRALEYLTTSALSPGLSLAAEQLAPRLPADLPHHHGHCPLCGSLPFVSLLMGKEGKRFGACSFCGHQYRIRRIACPYCDESDQQKLKLFRVAEYPDARVDVCETCGMYIKTLDLREAEGAPLPGLEDMATLALDVLAQGEGYKRPTLSAWGF